MSENKVGPAGKSDEIPQEIIPEAKDFVLEVTKRNKDETDNLLKGEFGHAVRALAR